MSTWIRNAYKNVGNGTGGLGRPWNPAYVNGALIEPQRNNWSCGPAALRYCLMLYGIDETISNIIDYAQSSRSTGTDENQLITAANSVGCELVHYQRRTPKTTKNLIENKLRLGMPLIVCTERWQHWIAVLHKSKKGFLIFDSSRPGPVIQIWSWKKLERRMKLAPHKGCKYPTYFIMALFRPVHR